MTALQALRRRWTPLDVAITLYNMLTALLILVFYANIPDPLPLLAVHVLLLIGMAALPPRGAGWEQPRSHEPSWRRTVRGGARFLRYTYPLLLVIFFFEEVAQTVHAITPEARYWFEPYLYAADRWLFGELPARWMSDWGGRILDEIMHGFYFSYYFIIIGGTVVAWFGPKPTEHHPGPGFERALTSVLLAFLLCFIWYPWLPARGPWENPELMAELPRFEGVLFTPIIEWIIAGGAVSGGCFPSSHVAGSWAMVLGLARHHRRAAVVLGVFAAGMSLACIYTRYHHGVDVPAGMLAAMVGAWLARRIVPTDPASA